MQPLLMILIGFALTFGSFAAGAVATAVFLAAEPVRVQSSGVDAAEVWPSNPMTVDTASQDYQRLPARPVPKEVLIASASADVTGLPKTAMLDATVTESIGSEIVPGVKENAAPALNPDHLEWCASRYRSYRPRDNSYTPYSGGRRECISPYAKASEGSGTVSPTPAAQDSYANEDVVEASFSQEQFMSAQHIQSCFARYRSYRPEDNSYQPYGGGPRRQCQ